MKPILCKGRPPESEPAPLAMRFMEAVKGEVESVNDESSDTKTYLGRTDEGVMDYETD